MLNPWFGKGAGSASLKTRMGRFARAIHRRPTLDQVMAWTPAHEMTLLASMDPQTVALETALGVRRPFRRRRQRAV